MTGHGEDGAGAMFRHAEETDRASLLEYLRREPEFNLFIIGDILNFGLRSEVIDVFVQESRGVYDAALLRYTNSLIPYTHSLGVDLSPCIRRINKYVEGGAQWVLSGKKDIIESIEPRLARRPESEKDLFFCVCRELRSEMPLIQLPSVRMATGADAHEIVDLLCAIAEFSGAPGDPQRVAQEIEQGKTVKAMIRHPASGRLICVASCVAESDASAMIVGVATRQGHRNRGYATACVYRLVCDLQKNGKSACLFFNNPAAGTIYHRLGFKGIGMWKMLNFHAATS